MDVGKFNDAVKVWAAEQIYVLAEHDSAHAQVEWPSNAKVAFRAVAAETRVPLVTESFETADLEVEKLHLKWIIAKSGRTNAEIALVEWAMAALVPAAMHTADVGDNAVMQQASEEQYGPSVPPMREVMRLCFPDIADGYTLHLYKDSVQGCREYRMSNGDCIGEIHGCVDDFASDEWAVGMFKFMEAFYRFAQTVPS